MNVNGNMTIKERKKKRVHDIIENINNLKFLYKDCQEIYDLAAYIKELEKENEELKKGK